MAAGPSDWYSITTHGIREQKAILALLQDGVYGEIAEQSFVGAGRPDPGRLADLPEQRGDRRRAQRRRQGGRRHLPAQRRGVRQLYKNGDLGPGRTRQRAGLVR